MTTSACAIGSYCSAGTLSTAAGLDGLSGGRSPSVAGRPCSGSVSVRRRSVLEDDPFESAIGHVLDARGGWSKVKDRSWRARGVEVPPPVS